MNIKRAITTVRPSSTRRKTLALSTAFGLTRQRETPTYMEAPAKIRTPQETNPGRKSCQISDVVVFTSASRNDEGTNTVKVIQKNRSQPRTPLYRAGIVSSVMGRFCGGTVTLRSESICWTASKAASDHCHLSLFVQISNNSSVVLFCIVSLISSVSFECTAFPFSPKGDAGTWQSTESPLNENGATEAMSCWGVKQLRRDMRQRSPNRQSVEVVPAS